MRIWLAALLLPMAGCLGSDVDEWDHYVTFQIDSPEIHVDTDIGWDDGEPLTAGQYTDHGGHHPDGVNAHDILWRWSDFTTNEIEVEWFSESWGEGFSLCAINDFPSATEDGAARGCFERGGYWAIHLNGEPATVGMSDLIVTGGDELSFTWTPA